MVLRKGKKKGISTNRTIRNPKTNKITIGDTPVESLSLKSGAGWCFNGVAQDYYSSRRQNCQQDEESKENLNYENFLDQNEDNIEEEEANNDSKYFDQHINTIASNKYDNKIMVERRSYGFTRKSTDIHAKNIELQQLKEQEVIYNNKVSEQQQKMTRKLERKRGWKSDLRRDQEGRKIFNSIHSQYEEIGVEKAFDNVKQISPIENNYNHYYFNKINEEEFMLLNDHKANIRYLSKWLVGFAPGRNQRDQYDDKDGPLKQGRPIWISWGDYKYNIPKQRKQKKDEIQKVIKECEKIDQDKKQIIDTIQQEKQKLQTETQSIHGFTFF